MAVLDIIGEAGAVQQGTAKSWRYFEGQSEVLRYRGEAAIIRPLYESYKIVAGFNPEWDSIDYEPGKGAATLTLTKSADGEAVYELTPNEISQSVAMHEAFDALSDADIESVYQAFNDYSGSSLTGDKGKLYKLLIHGIEEYNVSQYVLRETKTVSKRSTVTASFDNVNTVSDPPDTSAVNTLIGTLPTGEWIKKSPVVRQVGSRRWQIITEWWWTRKASSVLYGGTYLE